MKTPLVIVFLLIGFASMTFAEDVWVNGYYRKDGTYVRGHYRSAPDQYKWNNYGKPGRGQNYFTPRLQRDYDGDGTPNYLDMDDNNNGTMDDWER